MVETEFSLVRFKNDAEMAKVPLHRLMQKKPYVGMEPLHPEDVAEVIAFHASRAPHVQIADTLILPTRWPVYLIIAKQEPQLSIANRFPKNSFPK